MIKSKIQKQPKLHKSVVAAPQASAVNSALPRVRDVETAAAPEACAHSRIQDRAFAIFEKHGSNHGNDLQDWLSAERQVMAH